MIKKLNEFVGKELTEDEVYIFDVVLCDNDIDHDKECFSDNSLDTLQKLFIGKTGIFDRNVKGGNQTSRIFNTQVVLDDSKTTKFRKPYKYLKANAYMVRTSSNEDLIKEIDGRIKKEVSISCTAKTHRCSICGKDRYNDSCNHINGKYYDGKLCYTILDDVTNAYEWSFVAVPEGLYIDYYTSKEITEIAEKCKKALLDLNTFLHNIDNSNFDDWDKDELEKDKGKVAKMIQELHENFGTDE